MGSNSIPPKTLSDESINRGLVCAHMHFIARTQKILTFMSQTGECRQQKHTQHPPSTKTECDYLNGWIKKQSHTQKSHPKVVNPRDIPGERNPPPPPPKKKKTPKNKKHHHHHHHHNNNNNNNNNKTTTTTKQTNKETHTHTQKNWLPELPIHRFILLTDEEQI